MTTRLTPNFCPYKGLQPYTEDDRAYFFGRERDQEIIASNLFAAPLTVLYGASGVGKSSVLRAGVVPQLEETPRLAIVVFRDWQDAAVVRALKDAVVGVVGQRAGKREIKVDPALPFDEFLLECTRALRGTILLILDQFEEYFLYHSGSQAIKGFDADFARAVNRPEINANFLLAMREDGLSKLDRFQGRIPNLLSNLLRLEHLDREAAIRAIRKPLEEYNRRLAGGQAPLSIEDELVEVLLEQVKTGKVTLQQAGEGQASDQMSQEPSDVRIETPFLQMVLTRLWDEEMAVGSHTLRLSTLKQLGGAERIVRTHLDKVMEKLSAAEREIAARLFRFLVTPTGTKIAHTPRDLVSYAELPEERVEPVLTLLSSPDVRILRPVAPPPDRPADLRYEVFHDVLVPGILDWRARFVQDQQRREAERLRAEEAERQQRELAQAQAAAAAERQRAEERARAARRFRLLAGAAGVVALLAVIAGVFAWTGLKEKKEALRLHLIADQQREQITLQASADAIRQKANALRQSELRQQAERALEQAKAARQRADQQARISSSRELAAAAINKSNSDPELSTLLALQAISGTYASKKTVTLEAEDALHRAVEASRVRLSLFGHTGAVWGVAFSPDGKRLATASEDETAKVWDATSGKELLTLSGHTDEVLGIAFSPDGKRLATASEDKTAKVWDAASGKELLTLSGHSGVIWGVAFSPDSQRLATASGDKTAIVWDVASGKQLLTLSGHADAVSGVAFSADGQSLATASWDKTAKVWDAASGKELFALSGHSGAVWGVAFSPDGKRLATASADSTAKVWDATSGKELRRLPGHSEPVFGVAFSPHGKCLATASADMTAKVWDAASGKELLTLSGHAGRVYGVAFSSDGQSLATASWDKTAKVWDAASVKELFILSGHTGAVNGVAFSPDGKRLATASADNTAKVWDATSGKELRTLPGHSKAVFGVAFSPDGKRLATASKDMTAKVWDAASGKELLTLSGHSGAVWGVAFSPDGSRLATASKDMTAKVWDAASGKELRTLPGHSELIFGVAFSPDGKRLATASADMTAKVWDATSGKPLLTLTAHSRLSSAVFLGVAFSPDGQRLATANEDNTAKVWDAASGRPLRTLSGHSGWVFRIAFSPDGKLLATASADKTAKVWDAASGRELLTLSGHTGPVLGVAFSPDAKRLATASEDGTVRVYVLNLEDLVPLALKRVTRSFAAEECKKFLHTDTCPPTQSPLALVGQGNILASSGDLEGATASFRKAKELDPTLDLDPRADAAILVRSAAAPGLVGQGKELLSKGKVKEAIAAFSKAQKLNPTQISASSWNKLCWQGSLQGHAAEVMFACELAVKLDPKNGSILDSRGLARALTGNIEGAIADFEAFITQTNNQERKAQRQRWVDALKAGKNPFTPEKIKSLLNE